MILTFILIVALAIFIFIFFKNKAEIDDLKNRLSKTKNSLTEANHEEFSLDLPGAGNDFGESVSQDPLTGLPGREAFNDRLSQALNQSKRFEKSFAILLLDIREFRIINEAQGYETGDKLLKEAALRLQGVIRQIDTMTRYAGNKYIFLLPQLSTPETAAYVAQRLLDSIVQPFKINDQELFITASIGVAVYPSDGVDAKTIIANADDALHQAKVRGKSRFQFYRQELHALGQRELAMHAMISKPDILQQLKIYYQPHVNTVNNRVVCVQAIPCLEVPDFGLVTFPEFAKIAQNTGKITEIGEWMLRNSITQFKKWHDGEFKPEFLAMNITLHQIENPQFIYKVSQILQDLEMNPNQLVFELAEENLFSNSNSLEQAFEMLNHIGVRISLSIFALGHFALQKITKLPVNYLKINTKLLQAKNTQDNNEIIVHMIITLAKDMQIYIVADGVDNEKQKQMLTELGCEIMQGKYFGEPLPIESFYAKSDEG